MSYSHRLAARPARYSVAQLEVPDGYPAPERPCLRVPTRARALLAVLVPALLGGLAGCSKPRQPPPSPIAAIQPVEPAVRSALPPPSAAATAPPGAPLLPSGSAETGVLPATVTTPANMTPAQRSRMTPVVEAVARAAPSVVSVLTEQRPQSNPFGGIFGMQEDETSGKTSLGSGVIVDPRGLIVTNEHVVAGAARIRIQLSDGRELPATLIGADQSFDLAVLQADAGGKELPALHIGTATDLMIGETALAIGNPFGLSHTVTSGVISALHRVVQAKNRTYEDFIQTDAQINPGNSGGALLNIHGELIGINTAVHSGGPGIGFAIPIDRARTIVSDLLQFGRVRYGWTGIRPAALQNRRRPVGVVVAEVEENSPAAKAGIVPGDVVTNVGDEPTQSIEQFWDRMQHVLAGDEVRLKLLRSEVKFTAAPLEPREVSARAQRRLGLDVAAGAGGRAVVVRRVNAGSVADRIGFQPGDLVLQIGSRAVRSVSDFTTALGELRPGSDTVMLVFRGQYSYYVTVPL